MQIRRRRRRRVVHKGPKQLRINERIRIPEVRLIDENGEMVGVVQTSDALARAQDAGLDLVEVDPTANPSIVKIMDWGQEKYERDKKDKKAKVTQKKNEVKAIRLSFRIKGHDLETRVKQAQKFLDAGYKVKIDTVLKGREKAHRPQAQDNIRAFAASLGEDVVTLSPVSKQGHTISMTVEKKASLDK